MKRLLRKAMVVALLILPACTAPETSQHLRASVQEYNQNLRWKRFSSAASYLIPDERAGFLKRYLAAEDDLHIQSIEVRGVSPAQSNDRKGADVTVVAESYLLPSTVVRRTTILQHWEQIGGTWRLIRSSQELAPQPPPYPNK